MAEIYPELVSTDSGGRPFSVHYGALTPLLLNELQRQDRKVLVFQWLLGLMAVAGTALTVGAATTARRWRFGESGRR